MTDICNMVFKQKQVTARRALLDKYRATIAPTLDGYPALVFGVNEDFAFVTTINGPALRAEFAWSTVKRVLENGGFFRS